MQMQKAPIEKPMRVHITFDTPSKYHPPKFPKTQIYAGVLVCHTPDRNIPPLRPCSVKRSAGEGNATAGNGLSATSFSGQ